MDWKGLWKKFVTWVKIQLRAHEAEIRIFVNNMLDLAYQNLDNAIIQKLNPAIRKKVTNKVIAEILIRGIDIGTIKGKSEVSALVLNFINDLTKENE